MKYLVEHGSRRTPQSEPVPGSGQVENSAGGYAFEADRWDRFLRFLVLGTEGGSYYAGQRELTRESAEVVRLCVEEDGPRAVALVVSVSEEGRAAKNDPAIFALAMACAARDDATRRLALEALPRVCRIGTHLFHFAAFVEQFRGWGRGLRGAVADWYTKKEPDALAYQLVKYRQRDGWSHRDLLRLAHPEPPSPEHGALFRYATQGEAPSEGTVPLVDGFESVNAGIPTNQIAEITGYYKLPREALPPESLTDRKVWAALFDGMPLTALVRNLATMTRVGLLDFGTPETQVVRERLADREAIRKARVHPIALLSALLTYKAGFSARGSSRWAPVPQIVDALDEAFYLAFENVEATGKRWLLGLDVSGSMDSGVVAGVPGLTPRVGSVAMAMVTAASGDPHECVAFTSQRGGYSRRDTALFPFALSKRARLDHICGELSRLPFGGTDCALPMLYALQEGREVDCFVVYTDSETWAGNVHPSQALEEYRRQSGISAKLIVVGMVSNGFTIADPADRGMLDVVGFDTATPQAMTEFARMS